MVMYQSELMESMNLATGKITYYIKVCDVMKRVSRAAYDARYYGSDGLSCLYMKTSGNFRRTYRTVTFGGK